jgi:ribosome recycling factor
MTPLNQIANISVPEPRMLLIQPWDANALKDIERALLTSDLGINPTNDGKMIRLVIPVLTEERRKDLLKVVKKEIENSKIAVRNIRRDTNDEIKKLEKQSEISKDDLKRAEDEMQKLTDRYISIIDDIYKDKEIEILEV